LKEPTKDGEQYRDRLHHTGTFELQSTSLSGL
jgi:hypothetical protein